MNDQILKKQPLIYANVKNANGRIYTQEAIDTIKNQYSDLVSNRRALGELGHPDRDGFNSVSLTNASHMLDAMYQEGDILFGDIKILQTPSGKILKESCLENEIVFRPRSTGSVEVNGEVHIQQIISFDAILKKEDSWAGIEIEKDDQKWLLLIG